MSYYLKVDAVNFDNFIYDTNDLSTIRGGGLLLLNVLEEVEKLIQQELKLQKPPTVSKGASSGLFILDTEVHQALRIKNSVSGLLNKKGTNADPNPLRHATFTIDLVEKNHTFLNDFDRVSTLSRWQQMQAPSLSIPEPDVDVCDIDKVRPAFPIANQKHGKNCISASVQARRDYGLDQKRGEFYNRVGFGNLKFTSDLSELSLNPKKGILNEKIALIYIDGNEFGSIKREKCKDAKRQTSFDKKIREGQEKILKRLLIKADKDKNQWKTELGKIRLETLLWGGDEIIWVVPAWLGWFTIDFFFREASKELKFNGQQLKHAAGVVFCHHNSPIHRINSLARSLADDFSKNHRDQNMIAYQVLESFDHTGIDLNEYRKKRLLNLVRIQNSTSTEQLKHLLIAAENIQEFEQQVKTLKTEDFPKSKLYQIVYALYEGNVKQAERLKQKLPESKALQKIQLLLGEENAYWLHLIDLWDYVALEGDEAC